MDCLRVKDHIREIGGEDPGFTLQDRRARRPVRQGKSGCRKSVGP